MQYFHTSICSIFGLCHGEGLRSSGLSTSLFSFCIIALFRFSNFNESDVKALWLRYMILHEYEWLNCLEWLVSNELKPPDSTYIKAGTVSNPLLISLRVHIQRIIAIPKKLTLYFEQRGDEKSLAALSYLVWLS